MANRWSEFSTLPGEILSEENLDRIVGGKQNSSSSGGSGRSRNGGNGRGRKIKKKVRRVERVC